MGQQLEKENKMTDEERQMLEVGFQIYKKINLYSKFLCFIGCI